MQFDINRSRKELKVSFLKFNLIYNFKFKFFDFIEQQHAKNLCSQLLKSPQVLTF